MLYALERQDSEKVSTNRIHIEEIGWRIGSNTVYKTVNKKAMHIVHPLQYDSNCMNTEWCFLLILCRALVCFIDLGDIWAAQHHV